MWMHRPHTLRFTEGVETLKSQAESARALVEELQQRTQEQQEAFQRLTQESMDAYMDFFRDPLSVYQQTVDAAQTATQQGLENIPSMIQPSMIGFSERSYLKWQIQ